MNFIYVLSGILKSILEGDKTLYFLLKAILAFLDTMWALVYPNENGLFSLLIKRSLLSLIIQMIISLQLCWKLTICKRKREFFNLVAMNYLDMKIVLVPLKSSMIQMKWQRSFYFLSQTKFLPLVSNWLFNLKIKRCYC